ncbi:MAG: class I SAM-dependent methyltransferase [Candidatus Auribacterota bacterium]|nr:class I SAM-dependent methyltransferase [Candidatus Auribacterota bacterium]
MPPLFFSGPIRTYYRCRGCGLIYISPDQFPSGDEEKCRYDQHQNSPGDPAYRKFLSRLFLPLRERLSPRSHGLDFGSGPGPTLSVMLEEAGHTMVLYDHFYNRNPSVLERQYDFITATEVLEHLHHPGRELDRLWRCLKPGGCLGIMTGLAPEEDEFASWYYIRDPTHVCFFSRGTFEYLATRWQAECDFVGEGTVIIQKGSQSYCVV